MDGKNASFPEPPVSLSNDMLAARSSSTKNQPIRSRTTTHRIQTERGSLLVADILRRAGVLLVAFVLFLVLFLAATRTVEDGEEYCFGRRGGTVFNITDRSVTTMILVALASAACFLVESKQIRRKGSQKLVAMVVGSKF